MISLSLLNYAGVAVFAASGALAASRKQLDFVGFSFMAAITGVGGGTLRDLVLGISPLSWVADPMNIIVCISVACLVFFMAHLVEYRYRLLLWLDALGLSAYCVLGAHIGLSQGVSPLIAIVTGMLTATFGGILRDVLSEEKSVILSDEIYITCALLGATIYVFSDNLGIPSNYAVIVATGAAFLLRAGALSFGWTMPRYKPREKRQQS